MSTSINTITHALRVSLADVGSPIVLGHAFQLVAAAFGYPSSGVLQASGEPENLTDSMHLMVDLAQMRQRAASLGVAVDVDAFLQAMAGASRQLGGPRIHRSDGDLEQEFLEAATEKALDDDDVSVQMADTNTTGPWDANLEFSDATPLPLRIGDVFSISYEGQVQGEQDHDRPYSGHAANVSVQVSLTAIGRRLVIGPPKVEVMGAELDEGYYGMDDDGTGPPLGRLEAFAMELGVPFEEREQLEGAEATGDTTSAGAPNGYLVNIAHCESSPVVDRLRAEYPAQEIWVEGHALERISPFDLD
jgi:hypothetical protein